MDENMIVKSLRAMSEESAPEKEFRKSLKTKLNQTEKRSLMSWKNLRIIFPLVLILILLAFISIRFSQADLIDNNLLQSPIPGELAVDSTLRDKTEVVEYLNKVGGRFVDGSDEDVPGVFTIRFKDGVTQEQVKTYIQSFSGKIKHVISELNVYVITVEDTTLSVSNIPGDEIVEDIDQDSKVVLSAVPNDPEISKQWGLSKVNAFEAQEATADKTKKVNIAVIDTGACFGHPDLADKFTEGINILDESKSAIDEYGHGCAVAGVISANVNNNIGISGLSNNVKIMPVKVMGADGVGYASDVAIGIMKAVAMKARIINLSLGTYKYSSLIAYAVDYAVDRGVIVIASAGNGATNRPHYPSSLPGVISVGSLDENGQRSWFSNFGKDVDIYAPGGGIYTTDMGGGYKYYSGTSFSAPYTAGIIALEIELCHEPLSSIDNQRLFIDKQENTWDLCPENNAPVISSTPPAGPFLTGTQFIYQILASDSDGDSLQYVIEPSDKLIIDPATNIATWSSVVKGEYIFTLKVTDGEDTAIQTITIVVNDPPVEAPQTITKPTGNKAYCKLTPTEVWIYYPDIQGMDLWGITLKDPGIGSPVSGYGNPSYLVYATIVGRRNIEGSMADYTVPLYLTKTPMTSFVKNNYKMYAGWFSFAVARSNFVRAFVVDNADKPNHAERNLVCR